MEVIQHLGEISHVLLVIFPCDQEIINVYGNSWYAMKDLPHCLLEHPGADAIPKRKDIRHWSRLKNLCVTPGCRISLRSTSWYCSRSLSKLEEMWLMEAWSFPTSSCQRVKASFLLSLVCGAGHGTAHSLGVGPVCSFALRYRPSNESQSGPGELCLADIIDMEAPVCSIVRGMFTTSGFTMIHLYIKIYTGFWSISCSQGENWLHISICV